MTLKLFMYEKGLLSLNKINNKNNFSENKITKFEKNNLNNLQKKALNEICKNLKFSRYSTTLIHGVTGSGKTLVYFDVIKKALKENFQVLVLLPEIALTKQIAQRFKDYFGCEISLWHSSIGDKRKK